MKTWNVYFTERRRGRTVTKFVGEIDAAEKALRRAVKEVSQKAGLTLHIREAATDNWRRPDHA